MSCICFAEPPRITTHPQEQVTNSVGKKSSNMQGDVWCYGNLGPRFELPLSYNHMWQPPAFTHTILYMYCRDIIYQCLHDLKWIHNCYHRHTIASSLLHHFLVMIPGAVHNYTHAIICKLLSDKMAGPTNSTYEFEVTTVKSDYTGHLWDSSHWLLYRGDLLTG